MSETSGPARVRTGGAERVGGRPGHDRAAFARLCATLRPFLSDEALVRAALVHRSYCAEAPGESSNERLEFLGDSVLGLVVTETLYRAYPERREGDLSRMKAALVSAETLARLAASLEIGDAILLGRGEEASGGRAKASLLADTLEAIIGATYLSAGYEAARSLIGDVYGPELEQRTGELVLGDAKNRLQELAARIGAAPPAYELTEHGPDHAKHFFALVEVAGVRASGEGRSKKQAERAAAAAAIELLGTDGEGPG